MLNFIMRTWWLFVIIIVCAFTFNYPLYFIYQVVAHGIVETIKLIMLGLLGVAGSLIVIIALNSVAPYKLRTYTLNDIGITVSRGGRSKFFTWNQFECFYPYRSYFKENRMDFGGKYMNQLATVEQEFEGGIIYLKQKSSFFGLIKSFVVVCTEPSNSSQVMEHLGKYLDRKEMTPTSDLGLVFYKFK